MRKRNLINIVLSVTVCVIFVTGLMVYDSGLSYRLSDAQAANVVIEGSRPVESLIINLSTGSITTRTVTEYWVGSGVVIAKRGIILTAGHIIPKGTRDLKITLSDGRVFYASGWWVDSRYDIALIKIKADDLHYIRVYDTRYALKQGDLVYIVGNVHGIWDAAFIKGTVYNPSVSRCLLGSKEKFLMVDAEVEKGCSGGGVYYRGSLVGITSRVAGGACFAVPLDIILQDLNKWGVYARDQ
jgi:S1-C subfamily serine protease